MQGRLLDKYLSVDISTVCVHCGRPLQITVDSDLAYKVREEGADPLVFEPQVDIRSTSFAEPNIINAY